MKLQKALAVIGAGVLLFAASDAISYAATGSSLVLGKINAANATTTIKNTGTAPALKLLTKSASTAPMAVNGKGKVTNLYADRAATADKLGTQTLAQVRANVNAATLNGKTAGQITSDASSHLSWGVVNDLGTVKAATAGLTLTHLLTGQYCATIAGLDLSTLTTAGITATPVYDYGLTTFATPGRSTHVEVVQGAQTGCFTGAAIYVYTVTESTGAVTLTDSGFEVTIIH
jgi:hypothetical protein